MDELVPIKTGINPQALIRFLAKIKEAFSSTFEKTLMLNSSRNTNGREEKSFVDLLSQRNDDKKAELLEKLE